MEPTLLVAAAVGPLAAWVMLRDRRHPTGAWDVFLVAIVVGAATGRVAAMLSAGVAPWQHPLDVLILRGGVSTGWAAVGALVFVASRVYRSRSAGLADALAPAAVAALAGWHGACVLRSACLGRTTSLPIGWAATEGSARHPVELYAALLLCVLLVAVVLLGRMRPATFASAGTALAGSAAIRLVTEPLRVSIGGGPVWWYAAGIVAGVVLVVAGRRRVVTPT